MSTHSLCQKYKDAIRFLPIIAAFVATSILLSRYISDYYFDSVIAPVLIICSTAIALFCSWVTFRHADGLRTRKVWGWTVLAWGIANIAYLLCRFISQVPVMNMGAYQLTTHELFIGNLLGWLLLLYPTEALRPGWMNLSRALWQLIPVCVLVALDYVVPLNLAPIISLYPLVLLILLISHIRAYRIWCEENFSTLDDIDVQWIVRYLIIIILTGVVFLYICMSHSHTRGFTQLWLVIFLFVYGTEQILFRHDPWQMVHKLEKEEADAESADNNEANATYRKVLEDWMKSKKPYLNTKFQLIDLQQVLPMNRTYLSRFLHNEFDCTFYQFVNRYRIDEAMRLMNENRDMKLNEVSTRSGFSSPTVFTRIFTNFTGIKPREWIQNKHSALDKYNIDH